MPKQSKDFANEEYMRLLVMGAPKSGKTYTTLLTCEKPVYVINSDDDHAISGASRVAEFAYDNVAGRELQGIQNAIGEAKRGIKEGEYKTVVWDTISVYASRVEDVFAEMCMGKDGVPDGRRYWGMYANHLKIVLDQLFRLKAHLIVLTHYQEQSSVLLEGQIAKSGEGTVPLLKGVSRTNVPAKFSDIVFLEKKGGKRFFVTSSDGVFGPGCRRLDGHKEVEADIGKLWLLMKGKT